jgi:hypothetical protein
MLLPFGTAKPSQPLTHCSGFSGRGVIAGDFAAATDSSTTVPFVRFSVKSDGTISVKAGVCLLVQTFI